MKRLHDLYGLKYNPFLPHLPKEGLWMPPGAEGFFARLEMMRDMGGFALLTGEPGAGKSQLLRLLHQRLRAEPGAVVSVLERPQSRLADLYRELGDRFGITVGTYNRYGGFKALRERWRQQIKQTLVQPILLVDEAQEMRTESLCELRLLGSEESDSVSLMTVVLCGDQRLTERLRSVDLLSLASRVRARLILPRWPPEQLGDYLDHLLAAAGAPHLLTEGLARVLCRHAEGNLRQLVHMGEVLLAHAAQRRLPQVDENLYIEVFSRTTAAEPRQASAGRSA